MTSDEQVMFAATLITNVTIEIMRILKEEEIPENWTGIELRWFISDYFKTCRIGYEDNKKRKKEYRNDVLVNNII